MMNVGILLPTNNPHEYGTCLGPSLPALAPLLVNHDVRLLFHFQGPWTVAMMRGARVAAHNLGFKTHARYSQQRPYSAYRLRQDAALLWPDADVYMLCDDNVVFAAHGTPAYPRNTAERYADVLEYFATFPMCGVVTCEGSLGGATQQASIRPTTSALMATARGLFFRNLFNGRIHSPDEVKLVGGLGESVLAYRLMERGYFIAKQMNNPTRHLHLTKVRNYHGTLTNDTTLHGEGLSYVRNRWEDRWWTHSSGKFPQRLLADYLTAGGDMRAIAVGTNAKNRSSLYWKDYPR